MKVHKWVLTMLGMTAACTVVLSSAYGADTKPKQQELLQQSLTIYEIDRELILLEQEQSKLNAAMETTRTELIAAEQATNEAREHAAKVVRAYYMGDRDSLWTLAFSADSFSEGIAVLEYLQMILANDKLALTRHQGNWVKQTKLKSELQAASDTLEQTKLQYMAQRQTLVELQAELDLRLAQETEAAAIQRQMEELNELWNTKGLPQFKTYFIELGAAMKDLPSILTNGGGASTGKNLSLFDNGLTSTFKLTDTELNQFLRSKNKLFEQLTFEFKPDTVIASGKHDDMEMIIRGSYSLAPAPKEGGKPYIQLTIEELIFNGYTLPDSTIRSLEKQVSLGIYPDKLSPILQVSDVALEEGVLKIMLRLVL
ncbi:hypothetical protein [Paenibacillus sp. YYML68]|uniref:hypothetical protein n=1 Tax=Paenibacillus sp. YYML68 TaxID=2909250 RepID=UPI002490A2A5|nr:hypothetical protein [Paenibacillus sp. YYML68]